MEMLKHSSGYIPTTQNLEGYWDKPLSGIPLELAGIVEERFLVPWDELSSEQRRSVAVQYDYQHDPTHEPSAYFNLACLADDLKVWIDVARKESKDAVALALLDVAGKVEEILEHDRGRVGAEIQALRGGIKHASQEQAGRAHLSDDLVRLNQAARHWWANAVKHDPCTHPKNSDVAAWLTDRGMSASRAKHAAAIIRPEWAHSGRKPDA